MASLVVVLFLEDSKQNRAWDVLRGESKWTSGGIFRIKTAEILTFSKLLCLDILLFILAIVHGTSRNVAFLVFRTEGGNKETLWERDIRGKFSERDNKETLWAEDSRGTLWEGDNRRTLWAGDNRGTLWGGNIMGTLWKGDNKETLWEGDNKGTLSERDNRVSSS